MIVVFDLDGTLVDASKLHSKILADVVGATVPPEKIYSASSLNFLVMENLPKKRWRSIKDVTRRHEEAMLANVGLVEPMPGVYEMLEAIDAPKAVFTSAGRKLADAILENCYLRGYFKMVVTDDDVARKKPDSEGLFLVSDEFNEEDLIVVGNSEKDLLAAKKFGAPFIYFSRWGRDISAADYEAKDLRDIPALVASLS
jgi:HAD superfamily hydrolase (TIGR01549 family)